LGTKMRAPTVYFDFPYLCTTDFTFLAVTPINMQKILVLSLGLVRRAVIHYGCSLFLNSLSEDLGD
jgi:hypothetical protein